MDSNGMNEENVQGTVTDNNYYQQYTQTQQTYREIQQSKPSGMSIASMVCGILSIVLCCVWYITPILGIIALVFGILNLVRNYGGKGMAIAGIVTGTIGILLAIVFVVLIIVGTVAV